ncbi:phage tail assembly chaperone [Neorhizobium sp. P12A]|nr:phage tail assembly chaperone [Neorhizobium sp. P12A]
MRTAFGALGWKPQDFWNCTLTEYFEAIEGFNEANGAGEKSGAPTDEELEALVAKYG